MKKSKKIIIALFLFIAIVGIYAYTVLFSSNTNFEEDKKYLYIGSNKKYEEVMADIQGSNIFSNFESFNSMASRMQLSSHLKPGKYAIQQGMGNYTIVKMLRNGSQEPVKLVITKLRTKKDIIKKLVKNLEPDSLAWAALFCNPEELKKFDIDSNQIQCLFMPNTYEFYWNTEPIKVLEKLNKYYTQFWNEERRNKAKNKQLTPAQVITLASIVEEETLKKEDKLKIASTYLNRLKIGMPLQADPTLKFAMDNFALKRILRVHTQVVSPYNTYLNQGLIPGPICTPGKETIEAVLDAPQTNYLYFCAREDFSGYSNFASSLAEHDLNAKKYQQALNQRGIK